MIFVALNLIVDVLQTLIDPRIAAADARMSAPADRRPFAAPAAIAGAPEARAIGRGSGTACRATGRRSPARRSSLLIVLSAIFAQLSGAVRSVQDQHAQPAEAVGYRQAICSAPTSSAAICCPGCIYGGRLSLLMGVTPVLAPWSAALLGVVAGFVGGASTR